MKYVYLGLAIASELIGSSCLQASKQFTKLVPSVITVIAFISCFYFLSFALKSIPLGVAYSIWAGLGIVCTALIAVFIFKQSLDAPACIGIGFIVVGVIIMNLFSSSVSH